MLRAHPPRSLRQLLARYAGTILALVAPFLLLASSQKAGIAQVGYDDHKNMMEQLGIKTIRGGPNPNDQSTFDEAKANPCKDSMPDALRMKDGARVTRAKQWPKRSSRVLPSARKTWLRPETI